jgi:hypothetical protein
LKTSLTKTETTTGPVNWKPDRIMEMNYSDKMILILCLFTFSSMAAFMMIFLLKKKKNHFARELALKDRSLMKITEELKELKGKYKRTRRFQKNLAVAEQTRQPAFKKVSYGNSHVQDSVPEKYRLVHALTSRKMTVDEIASFLAISAHEARQLVNLAKLVQQ